MEYKKVVILLEGHEEIADEGLDLLVNNNYKLYFPKDVEELLTNSEYLSSQAMLVRGAVIDRTIIENMPKLKIIARCGVGTDNIDIQVASEEKIFVSNVPDANFISVAEHVIGMLISLSHQIVNGDRAIRQGQFDARHRYMGSELTGKTIGIIGFGRIGQLVAKKCIQGLDMNVIAYDPYIKELDLVGVQLVDNPDEIFEKSDFITLHLPYIPSLQHFINKSVLKKMKKSAYIINCARGGLIDEKALAEAINTGEIAGAGIDVFQNEPPETDHVLWGVGNLIATPHMGASTNESLTRMAVGAAEEIIRVLENDEPRNILNKIS